MSLGIELLLASSMLMAATPGAVVSTPPEPPSEALCTAHFDQLSRQLAQRIAETPEPARSPLQAELINALRKGAAFVGHAYLESVPEDEAKAQLERAKAELVLLSRAERERMAPVCDGMAAAIRKQAAGWQRLITDRLADRRAQRLVKSASDELQKKSPP